MTMLIFDIEELVFRARDHYRWIKSYSRETQDSQKLKELSDLLFCEATEDSLKSLEIWMDENEEAKY